MLVTIKIPSLPLTLEFEVHETNFHLTKVGKAALSKYIILGVYKSYKIYPISMIPR